LGVGDEPVFFVSGLAGFGLLGVKTRHLCGSIPTAPIRSFSSLTQCAFETGLGPDRGDLNDVSPLIHKIYFGLQGFPEGGEPEITVPLFFAKKMLTY